MKAMLNSYGYGIVNSYFGVSWNSYGSSDLGSRPGAYSVTVTLHGKPKCQVSTSFTVQAGEDCDKSEPLAIFYDGETYQGCSAEEMAARRAAAKDFSARSESFSRSATADPSAAESSSLSSSAEDACEINIEVECKNNYLFEIKNLEDGETVNWSYDLGPGEDFVVEEDGQYLIIRLLKGSFKEGASISATVEGEPDKNLTATIVRSQYFFEVNESVAACEDLESAVSEAEGLFLMTVSSKARHFRRCFTMQVQIAV